MCSLKSGCAALANAIAQTSEHAHELDAVTWLASVDEIVVHDHIDGTRQLSGRRTFGHLLNADHLMVSEDTVTKLCGQGVSIWVLGRIGRRRRWQVAQHGRVAIVARVKRACLLCVMDRLDDLGPNKGAFTKTVSAKLWL